MCYNPYTVLHPLTFSISASSSAMKSSSVGPGGRSTSSLVATEIAA